MRNPDSWLYAALLAMSAALFFYGIADEDIVVAVIAVFTALVASYDFFRHG